MATGSDVQTVIPCPIRLSASRPSISLIVGKTTGRLAEKVSLSAGELTRHAAFIGVSGSGKTTVALKLIEQLLLQGIPAILIDRKGDLCVYARPGMSIRDELDGDSGGSGPSSSAAMWMSLFIRQGAPMAGPCRSRRFPPGWERFLTSNVGKRRGSRPRRWPG